METGKNTLIMVYFMSMALNILKDTKRTSTASICKNVRYRNTREYSSLNVAGRDISDTLRPHFQAVVLTVWELTTKVVTKLLTKEGKATRYF